MKTIITSFLSLCTLCVLAQNQSSLTANTASTPGAQPWGKVDIADLEMKTCSFEPDANAEVLFDKAFEGLNSSNIFCIERHVRIKVFNDFGKAYGNVKISYGTIDLPSKNDIDAETFNYENGKIVITPLEKNQIYTEKTDKYHSTLIFELPNVKVGSVIEFKYKWNVGYYPNWYFQNILPTRYSEIKTALSKTSSTGLIRVIPHVRQDFSKEVGKYDDLTQLRAMTNIRSLPDEVFMGSRPDNLQRIEYMGISAFFGSWPRIGELFKGLQLFSDGVDGGVKDEALLLKQVKQLATQDEKVSFIFNKVRTQMNWDGKVRIFPENTTSYAWNKQTGSSAEINLILCHLLRKAGIRSATPMVIGDKKDGRMNPGNPSVALFNGLVVLIPVDSAKNYVLDASNKFNLYNTIPTNLLNSFGFNIDLNTEDGSKLVFLSDNVPAVQSIFLNAEVNASGTLIGNAEIASSGYDKSIALNKYKTSGEQKYIDYLLGGNNNMKIADLKLEDADDDNAALTQKFTFKTELAGSDGNYIYINPSILTLMGKNPFITEDRQSSIDLGYRDNYSINGVYKIPPGYKADSFPKNISMVMPDQSITFTRAITQQEGSISIRYVLNHKKTFYFASDYPDLRGFYKQLYDLLNEQIVLKKI